MDAAYIWMWVAIGGLLLSGVLFAMRLVRPVPFGERFHVLGRQPGESVEQHRSRRRQLLVCACGSAGGVVCFLSPGFVLAVGGYGTAVGIALASIGVGLALICTAAGLRMARTQASPRP